MNNAETVFVEAVVELVPAVLAGLHPVFRREDGRLYVVETEHARITIVLEWTTIATMLKPLPANVGECYAEIQADIGWVHSPEEIRAEVERQLKYIRQRYDRALTGDLEGWNME